MKKIDLFPTIDADMQVQQYLLRQVVECNCKDACELLIKLSKSIAYTVENEVYRPFYNISKSEFDRLEEVVPECDRHLLENKGLNKEERLKLEAYLSNL